MGLFHMLDPAGAAGGEHGELCTGLHLLQELGTLLHDGEVGGEVGVIHNVNAQTAKSRDNLAGYGLGCGHAELLSKSHTDRRGKLNHHTLVRIVDHAPHLGNLAVDGDGTRRADGCTLAAAHTARLDKHLAEAGSHDGFFAAFGKVDGADILHLGAHTYTKAAKNALGGISRDAG